MQLRIITRQLGGQRRTTQQANVSLEEIGAYTLFEGQNRELHDVVSSMLTKYTFTCEHFLVHDGVLC